MGKCLESLPRVGQESLEHSRILDKKATLQRDKMTAKTIAMDHLLFPQTLRPLRAGTMSNLSLPLGTWSHALHVVGPQNGQIGW